MRVTCFYTFLHPACKDALPPETELVWTGYGDDAYWQELAARWDGSDDLVVIEHDIEIHSQVVSEFASCPSPWCVFPYDYPGWTEGPKMITRGLGCTKFTAKLQRQFPADFIAANIHATDGLPPVPFWHNCDLYIARTLTRAGLEECRHSPPVTHHKRKPV